MWKLRGTMIMGKNVAVSRPEGKSGNCFTGPNVRLFIYNNGRKIIQNADAVIKWKNLRIRKYRKKKRHFTLNCCFGVVFKQDSVYFRIRSCWFKLLPKPQFLIKFTIPKSQRNEIVFSKIHKHGSKFNLLPYHDIFAKGYINLKPCIFYFLNF